MRFFLFLTFSFFVFLSLEGCLEAESSFTRVAPGIWRGVLELEPFRMAVRDKDSISLITDPFREGQLPFNFEVIYTEKENFYIEIINGSERIRCDSILYGRDRSLARDTFNVYFPEYQTYLHAEVRGGAMQGEWIVPAKENYRIPFFARAGQSHRFTPLQQQPTQDISGEWVTLFGIDKEEQSRAIGEFMLSGNQLAGTFRTETGDYRYLDGTVQGRKFWLSAFDGAHAYLFSGVIQGDSLQGEFRSGTHYRTLWKAWRDPNFQLGNPDSLTQVRNNEAALSFKVETPDGRTLSFPGPEFENKIKIFTIMGTWCPNCRDEQVFLKEYMKENPEIAKSLSVVGFSFERHQAPAQANAHLMQYKRKMELPYEIVYAGKATREEAQQVFPVLNEVLAFPTMIILDKKNRIRRVHTGFDGPATTKYQAFKASFSSFIETLHAE